MIRIKNTSQDRTKTLLHRMAPKLEMEPVIHGQKLRMGTHVDVTEEWVQKHKPYLKGLEKTGVIELKRLQGPKSLVSTEPKLDANGLKIGGPTLEEFLKAGRQADYYPPEGWAEVPSAGLTAFRKEKADKVAAEAKAKADAEAAEHKAREEAELAALIAAEEAEAQRQKDVAAAAAALITETAALPSIAETVLPPVPVAEAAPSEEKHEGKRGGGKKKLF